MKERFIIDAHLHTGAPGVFFVPEFTLKDLLGRMDNLSIAYAVCIDHLSIHEGANAGLEGLRRAFEESEGRVYYLGVFDPRYPKDCFRALKKAINSPGFTGIKIHPSFHHTAADADSYEPIWQFAKEHNLPILTHSWSTSEYNAAQRLSTPEKFESFAQRFPEVLLVLGHSGGRGAGRIEAVRMVNKYPNLFLDFAGDIFCFRLIEELSQSVPPEKILFGSDFPWLDPRSNLTRVLLAKIRDSQKMKILRDNARFVYKIPKNH